MVSPWLGMALVLGVLGLLLGGLRWWQRRGAPHPELIRKLLHVGMGLLTLSFPWLFQASWPVLTLAVLSVGGFVVVRISARLRQTVGQVAGAVARSSLGEIYFPVAVAILFALFVHYPDEELIRRQLLYCIPILLLTLADALAALIGVHYGQWHYATSEGYKSTEGSVAFFLCAFLCVHVPLLLWTSIGRTETLLIAILLAFLATMFEAIAWGGLDNLALPLVSYLLLRIYWPMSATELLARLGITACVLLLVLVYAWRTTLVGSAMFGAFLVGYISWALGGWRWLVPPLIVFVTYTLLSPRTIYNSKKIHNIHAVVCVASAGLLWLFVARVLDRLEGLLYPFTLAFAAHLAIIGIARLRRDYPQLGTTSLLTVCILQAWVLLFLPYLVVEGFAGHAPWMVLGALPAIAVAACLFYWMQPELHDCPVDTARWVRQAGVAGMGSLLGLAPLSLIS